MKALILCPYYILSYKYRSFQKETGIKSELYFKIKVSKLLLEAKTSNGFVTGRC